MKTTQIILLTGMLLMPFAVHAATSGSCAPLDEDGNEVGSCTWTLDGDTLTISGKGPMKDYARIQQGLYETTDAPWNDRNSDHGTGSMYQIKNVVVEDGITNIGDHFMAGAIYLENLKIGDGVKTIGNGAFYVTGYWIPELKVDFGKNIETIEPNAFHSSHVSGLVLPETLKTIGEFAFWDSLDEEIIVPSSVETIGLGAFSFHHTLSVLCEKSKEALCQGVENDVNNNSFLSKYAQNLSIGTYEKQGNLYIIDGVAYRSIRNYSNHEPIKRIYTIKEANEAAGKKNKVMIRYR